MELLEDGRIAVMKLPLSAFRDLGAQASDTEDFVNEPLRMGLVTMSVLLVEANDGVVRVSFRSKEPRAAGDSDIDVAELAAAFGGGGHRKAAGVRIRGQLGEVEAKVSEKLRTFQIEKK
jgi:phosphoesterase RecJ-like protein